MAMAMQFQDYVNLICYTPSFQDMMNVPVIPRAVVVEQPSPLYRFRYETEQGAHGSIMGEFTSGGKKQKKSYPKVKIENYPHPVILQVRLYTSNDDSGEPHVHELQRQGQKLPDGIYEQPVSNPEEITELPPLDIRHVANRGLNQIITKRLQAQGKSPEVIKKEKASEMKRMKPFMNAAALRFEFLDASSKQPLCHTYSVMINNHILKICEMSRCEGRAKGNDTMIILCEKVAKADIEVHFFENDWRKKADFTEIGVHRQFAISLRTPAYRNTDLSEKVTVQVVLVRPSDKAESVPRDFVYVPDMDEEHIKRKRQRTEIPDQSREQNTVARQIFSQPSTSQQPVDQTQIEFQPTIQEFTQLVLGDQSTTNLMECDNQSMALYHPEGTASLAHENLHLYIPTPNLISLDENEPSSAKVVESIISLESQYPHLLRNNDPLLSQTSQQAGVESISMDLASFEGFDVESDSPVRAEPDAVGYAQSSLIPRSSVEKAQTPKAQPLPVKEKKTAKKTVPDYAVSGYQIVYKLAVRTAEQLQNYAKTNQVSHLLKCMSHLLVIQDDNGDNAIHNAVIHAHEDNTALYNLLGAVDHTAEENPLNMFNNLIQTPLHIAVHVNSPKMVEALIQHGADVNQLDRHGNSALHLACHHAKDALVKILLNKDLYPKAFKECYPNIDLLNYSGYASLHLAIQAKSLDCVRMLCEAGADINVEDGTCGRTAIYTAVEFRSAEILQELLNQQSANVDGQTFGGYTPLHLACSAGNTEMVHLLLGADADPSIESNVVATNDEISEDEDQVEKLQADSSAEVEEQEVESHGFSSFDLANKAEILKLLKDATQKKVLVAQNDSITVEFPANSSLESSRHEKILSAGTSHSSFKYDDSGMIDDDEFIDDFVSVKPEEPHSSISDAGKCTFGDSGLGLQQSELDSMKQELKDELAKLLDKPGPKDWKCLSKHLNLDSMDMIFESAASPTIALLPYISSVKDLCEKLEEMEFPEALHTVEKYYMEAASPTASSVESTIQQMKKLRLK